MYERLRGRVVLGLGLMLFGVCCLVLGSILDRPVFTIGTKNACALFRQEQYTGNSSCP